MIKKNIQHFGKYIFMLKGMMVPPENFKMYWRETMRQMNNIGVTSLLIIGIISSFVGAVTALQFGYQLGTTPIPDYMLGYIVRDMMLIELAPTLSALVLAGKVGSNVSAELGSMRISEQIDALEIMGVNTLGYLIGPKILAGVFIFPFLVILAAGLGMMGGLISADSYGIAPGVFSKGLQYLFRNENLWIMLVKAFTFAFLVTSISCYQGYNVKPSDGALGIGRASTRAVVFSSIAVIFFDYIIALFMAS